MKLPHGEAVVRLMSGFRWPLSLPTIFVCPFLMEGRWEGGKEGREARRKGGKEGGKEGGRKEEKRDGDRGREGGHSRNEVKLPRKQQGPQQRHNTLNKAI